jgi:hypothetical protein
MKAQVTLEFVMMLVFLLIIFIPISIESLRRSLTVSILSEQSEAKGNCLMFSGMISQAISTPSSSNVTVRLPEDLLDRDFVFYIYPEARDLMVSWRDLELSCPLATDGISYSFRPGEYNEITIGTAPKDSPGIYSEDVITSFGNITVNHTSIDSLPGFLTIDEYFLVSNRSRISHNFVLANNGGSGQDIEVEVSGLSDYSIYPESFQMRGNSEELVYFTAEPTGTLQKGLITIKSDTSGNLNIPVVIFDGSYSSFIHPYEYDCGNLNSESTCTSSIIIYSESGEKLLIYKNLTDSNSPGFRFERKHFNMVSEDGGVTLE